MNNKTAVALCLALGGALGAWAGTRVKETQGQVPSSATDGIDLREVTACRTSARMTDGGTIGAGTIQYYRYETATGWLRSPSVFDCSMELNKLTDGGSGPAQDCPIIEPLVQSGRIGAIAVGFTNPSGTAITPIIKQECWGPALP